MHAALGNIALRQGRRDAACEQWKLAMELRIDDAALCYQYAVLAEEARVPADEIRAALLRAIALRPDFDDAHYRLGLLEANSGQYDAAVQQLRAMRRIAPARAYGYWTALASALTEMDQRDEAKKAAG